MLVDHEPARLARRIRDLVDLCFDQVYLHHVGKAQDAFLEVAQQELLPTLKG